MDDVAQQPFGALRRARFPPERSLIPAHLTLFHALPGEDAAAVSQVIAAAAAGAPAMAFRTAGVLFLGRGAAFRVDCPGLVELHGRIRAPLADRLTQQDRQPLKPHVTVQNKVAPGVARRTAAELAELPRSRAWPSD